MLEYSVRPISSPGLFTGEKPVNSPFSIGWSGALDLLEREVLAIKGTDVVIEIDVPAAGIRNDGRLRANAVPATDRIVVAFESQHGPLQYASGRYVRAHGVQKMLGWQSNVYAVAKTLEALRSVDRWGAASSGQQYRGYLAIEGPRTTDAVVDEHIAWLRDVTNAGPDSTEWKRMVRIARVATHPDRGGSIDDYHRVSEVEQILIDLGRIS